MALISSCPIKLACSKYFLDKELEKFLSENNIDLAKIKPKHNPDLAFILEAQTIMNERQCPTKGRMFWYNGTWYSTK